MIIDVAELERRYLLRIAGAHDNKVYIGPEIVNLPMTNACNLRCQYCITSHTPGNPAHFEKHQFFPKEKFLDVVRDCVDLNVDQISICGTGESTIHPLFREMTRHLEQQPLKIKLFTNATFPLDYCSDVIRVDHVVINLGAFDRQQYLDLHGRDLFDRVVNNIKRLVALRDAHKPEFYIQIRYVVNTLNIDQKQKMQNLKSELKVNSVWTEKMTVTPFNREIALPEKFSSDLADKVKRTPPVCLNGWFESVISLDYETSSCRMIPYMRAGNFDKFGGFKQYWLSPHTMEIRLSGKYGHIQKKYRVCETCSFYDKNMQRAQTLSRLRIPHDH